MTHWIETTTAATGEGLTLSSGLLEALRRNAAAMAERSFVGNVVPATGETSVTCTTEGLFYRLPLRLPPIPIYPSFTGPAREITVTATVRVGGGTGTFRCYFIPRSLPGYLDTSEGYPAWTGYYKEGTTTSTTYTSLDFIFLPEDIGALPSFEGGLPLPVIYPVIITKNSLAAKTSYCSAVLIEEGPP